MYAQQARASSRHSDLEEGETFSSASRSSTHSDSSYHPPLTVAADPDVVSRAIEKQQGGTSSPVSKDPQPKVAAEQLRQRAQGALLSLKPHNISYDELVAEGLSPSILKTLYEQVGLKVSSSSGNAPKTSDHAPKLADEQTTAVASTITHHPPPKTSDAPPPSASCPPSDPNTQTDKPLERKELIARKLAAQAAAARTAKVPGVESNAVAKDTLSAQTIPSSATSDESLIKKNAVPVRPKSKAQTELARQRILELQQQALLKTQQKNKSSQSSQALESDTATDASNTATPSAQHPLPVRPPIPQPPSAATIPGLVMVDSKHDSTSQVPRYGSPAIAMDPTPIQRPFQRKRPRASDFDELESGSKKHIGYGNGTSGPDKLIIEFSDDESLYGDDDDAMDMDTGQELEVSHTANLALPRPTLPKYPSSISTPQGSSWQSDNEDMQRKNQEIQEMHRRIAYLEEKRKAKAKLTAGSAESPPAADDSGKSSSISTTESNAPNADKSNPSPGSPPNPVQHADNAVSIPTESSIIDSFNRASLQLLAFMNIGELDMLRDVVRTLEQAANPLAGFDTQFSYGYRGNARFKLSQSAEIIAVLRNFVQQGGKLDLEYLSRLRELANLKLQIPPEPQGKISMIPGLPYILSNPVTHLQSPAPPVSNPVTYLQSPAPPVSNPVTHLQSPAPPVSNDEVESSSSAMDESADVSSPSQVSSSGASAINGESTDVAHQQTSMPSTNPAQPKHKASASPSNITGSTKDDSTDSSDSDDDESDQESSASIAYSADDLNAAFGHSHPEHTLPAPNEDITMEDSADKTSPSDGFRRESSTDSSESDSYEPPEPEDTAEPDSPYSPPLGPVPDVSVDDNAGNALDILDEPSADEKLTDAPLVPVLESRSDPQIGILGSQPPTATATAASGSKFTPYISPLRQFKAYRYHQGFTTDVSDGYRSLTYSHDIDWNKDFCPYELAGGVCNDRSCDFQHFRDITLSDDKVLIEMGSVREGQTEPEKEQYRAGLKEIINEMRRDKVKDFSTVASEIVAYRRRFLQDPTRVLPL